MTYDEKIVWLRRYRQALQRQTELEQEVEQLDSTAKRVTRILSGMPINYGGEHPMERTVEKLLETKTKLEMQIQICANIREEIINVIECVKGQRDNEILRRRYILGQTWETISTTMGIGERWIRRRHHSAVNLLDL